MGVVAHSEYTEQLYSTTPEMSMLALPDRVAATGAVERTIPSTTIRTKFFIFPLYRLPQTNNHDFRSSHHRCQCITGLQPSSGLKTGKQYDVPLIRSSS
jgi:hypothetical protein